MTYMHCTLLLIYLYIIRRSLKKNENTIMCFGSENSLSNSCFCYICSIILMPLLHAFIFRLLKFPVSIIGQLALTDGILHMHVALPASS